MNEVYHAEGPRHEAGASSPEFLARRRRTENHRIDHLRRDLAVNPDARPPHLRRQQKFRVLWTKGKIERLGRLSAGHGNVWAYIKQLDAQEPDPKLRMQSTVDMKGKMRNIKRFLIR